MNKPDLRPVFFMKDESSKKPIRRRNLQSLRGQSTRTKALMALALVSFFWGTTWLASKAGVRGMPALQMAGIRQLAGGLIYVVYFLSKGRALPRGKQWGPILILSFLNFICSNGLSTWGVKYISSGLGAIIGAVFPLWLVVIAWIGGQSRLSPKAVIGFVLGFLGICIIFYEHLGDFWEEDFRFGIILSITATITWAFATLYTKKQALAFNPYFSIGLQMVISGIVLTIIAGATGNSVPLRAIPAISWWSISYLVLFGSVLSFIAYLYALQHLPTGQVSIYAYINPVVAVLLGAAIYQEKLTLYIAVGGAVTLLGVYLVNEGFRSGGRDKKKLSELDSSVL